MQSKYEGFMKYVSSKQFRAQFSSFCADAEKEIIYIARPGGRLLMLQSLSDEDAKDLRKFLGEPEAFAEKAKSEE